MTDENLKLHEEAENPAEPEVSEEVIEEPVAEAVEEACECGEEAGDDCENAEDPEVCREEKKSGKDKKEGFFKKNRKDKKDEQIEELTDRVQRQMAEFENFRKRSEKEKTQMFDMGAKTIIEKILPVIDNFERGFGSIEQADKDDAFVQGMDMVYKQLMTELENAGVKPIEALGEPFNPDLHNAVMQVESDTYESGVVAQELMKGYTYKDTVVRFSMVAVVQ